MLKKFAKWFKSLFSTKFITPVVNEKLNTAMEDKMKRWRNEYQKQKNSHDQTLADFLRTYFDRTYVSDSEMDVAYDVANRAWKKYCREVNSTSKYITLNKDAFEKECVKFVERVRAKHEAKLIENEQVR